jgi:hypothetical protein
VEYPEKNQLDTTQKHQQRKGIILSFSTKNVVAGLNLGGLHETLPIPIGSQYIPQVTTSTVTSPIAKGYPLTNKGQKMITTPPKVREDERNSKPQKKHRDSSRLSYNHHRSE